jgi:ZipA, C-terminal FtsZ-binding domain
MSDLQLSLLMIGAVVVGAVLTYNWVQERSLRRRLQQSFGAAHDDVLLKAGLDSTLGDGRLEPQLVAGVPARGLEAFGATAETEEGDAGFDALLDYVAEIAAEATMSEALVGELVSRVSSCGKPARARGFDPQRGEWEDIVRGTGGRYTRLRAGLQIANRAGPVSTAQLAAFCDGVAQCAEKVPAAAVECPDPQAALKLARDLDAFCATVDVAIGVNIVAPEGQPFAGTRIRAAAESVGFKLEPDGVFYFRGGDRHALFTLDNHEPAPFIPESIKGLSTSGITLLLDVPRVANGAEVLARMLNVAENLASAIGGRLVDDNRATLSDAGVSRIREQLSSIQAAMTARDVPAGGTRALRLFS